MLTNAVSASECASRVRMFAKAQALGVNMGLAMQAADGAAGGTGAQVACWCAPWICTADTSEVFSVPQSQDQDGILARDSKCAVWCSKDL